MIELKDSTQLTKAIERAKASDLLVQASGLFRQYHVTNRATGTRYTVDFFVHKADGACFAGCTCKAGLNNVACKHVTAAAALHVCVAAALRTPQGPPVLVSRKPQVSTFRGIRL